LLGASVDGAANKSSDTAAGPKHGSQGISDRERNVAAKRVVERSERTLSIPDVTKSTTGATVALALERQGVELVRCDKRLEPSDPVVCLVAVEVVVVKPRRIRRAKVGSDQLARRTEQVAVLEHRVDEPPADAEVVECEAGNSDCNGFDQRC
jgi:hypothetical protein